MSTWKLNFLALVGVICIGANSTLAQTITLFDSRMQTNVLQSSDIAVTDNVTSALAWMKEVFKPLRSGTGLLSR
ncbi:MAG TPA: hypothetical protein DIU35_00180 [Candidatus Latescibacteria bacterium]|nr:hypothetical protein [Gemmatimonadota bacterium]HCR15874.1 hypothetical protein [Candidatus Latescibacterota bacterium]